VREVLCNARSMRWWRLGAIALLAGSNASAQTPRCDASLTDLAKISEDWEIKPNPPVRIGENERLILVRCNTCDPPVAVSIKTTDLTQPSETGPVIEKGQSFETVLADPLQKKAFADWYNSEIQRLYPTCEVQTELRDGNTNSSGMTTTTFFYGAWCRGQEREHSSGIEYIGGRGTCAFRISLLWSGKAALPDASLDRVNKLFDHMKLLK